MPRGYQAEDDEDERRRLGEQVGVSQQGLGGNVSGTVNVNAPGSGGLDDSDDDGGDNEPFIMNGEPGSGGGGSLYGATDEDVGFTDQEMDPIPADMDMLAEDWNRGYLEHGPADTTDEEAFINERIRNELGGQLVGQRARMGRAGFGSSGALAALEGDAMRQANMDAQGQIFDAREREQNQAFEQGIAVQEIDVARQKAAADLAREEAEAAAINAFLGSDPLAFDRNGNGRWDPGEGQPPTMEGTAGATQTAPGSLTDENRLMNDGTTDWSGVQDGEYTEGDTYLQSDEQYDYYTTGTGDSVRYYRVPRGG